MVMIFEEFPQAPSPGTFANHTIPYYSEPSHISLADAWHSHNELNVDPVISICHRCDSTPEESCVPIGGDGKCFVLL